ncbi:MAG: NAD(P)H-dependent oxidoreductase [Bacteroidales bacterium]
MKYLIVYAHPNPNSFNHAILEKVIDKLTVLGATVEVRDLYKINFNPCLSLADIEAVRKGEVLPDVKTEQEYINQADKIIFISPIWWNLLPAILKGYFDRVFTIDFAVAKMSNGYTGLLGAKKFGMFNTIADTKENMVRNGDSAALQHLIDNGIFKYVDSPLCFHQIFYQIDTIGEEKRHEMLTEVEKIVEQFMLDPNYCPFFG